VSGKPFRGFESHPLRQNVCYKQMVNLNARRLLFVIVAIAMSSVSAPAQSHARLRRAKASAICGNPQVHCRTSVDFEPYDLPFRVPKNSVIFDTELFYVVILKSVPVGDNDCDTFVPETERLATQALFPDHKVFTSRCVEAPYLFYSNISDKHRIMAVYAGTTLAESNRVLAAAKATGKFPGAHLRRMRTGFNGT
jgi:hypothetical protein